jgi:PIN domain nuclease of toxin-antitoxin system
LSHILLDTHTWAWSLTAPRQLSPRALAAMEQAETVSISAITLYEVGQKVRLGKWPEMVPLVPSLVAVADSQDARLLSISAEIGVLASAFEWAHRDPFDRLIAATAISEGMVLVSADEKFDDLMSERNWPGRVW